MTRIMPLMSLTIMLSTYLSTDFGSSVSGSFRRFGRSWFTALANYRAMFPIICPFRQFVKALTQFCEAA